MPQERPSVIGRLPEGIVAQNGVRSESPFSSNGKVPAVGAKTQEVSAEIADQVRAMLEAEYTNGAKNHDYFSYRQLALAVSPAAFRKNRLSGVLNLQFGGDILLAVRQSLSDLRAKPLLSLARVNYADSLQNEWRRREQEIEDQISGRQKQLRKSVLVGPQGEPITKKRKSNSRKKPRFYFTFSETLRRRPLEDIVEEEAEDVRRVIDGLVRPGETALKVMGGYEIAALTSLLGKVGEKGRVFYVTKTPNLKGQLFQNIFHTFVNFQRLKGVNTRKEKLLKRNMPSRMAEDISSFLTGEYLRNIEFDERGYRDPELRDLATAFYKRFPLIPIYTSSPPFPREIKSGSVDVVMEMDRFFRVPENEKEEFLYEIDRILKPGGRIIIREGSREQAEIEYYGQELLTNGYRRQRLLFLKHPDRWMIFVKQGSSQEDVIEQGSISQGKIQSRNEGQNSFEALRNIQIREEMAAEMGRNIYLTLQEMKSTQDEASGNSELSLAWFRKNGYLPLLMQDFNGDIKKAVEFAQKNFRPDGTKVSRPKGGKTSYTIEDISQELGIETAIIRGKIREMGVKRIAERSRSGSSVFNRGRMEARRLRFSQEEYTIIVDSLKRQAKT